MNNYWGRFVSRSCKIQEELGKKRRTFQHREGEEGRKETNVNGNAQNLVNICGPSYYTITHAELWLNAFWFTCLPHHLLLFFHLILINQKLGNDKEKRTEEENQTLPIPTSKSPQLSLSPLFLPLSHFPSHHFPKQIKASIFITLTLLWHLSKASLIFFKTLCLPRIFDSLPHFFFHYCWIQDWHFEKLPLWKAKSNDHSTTIIVNVLPPSPTFSHPSLAHYQIFFKILKIPQLGHHHCPQRSKPRYRFPYVFAEPPARPQFDREAMQDQEARLFVFVLVFLGA